MATLLKRSDAPLYRIYVGNDCAAFVKRLTRDQCFDVHEVLHAPSVLPNACDLLQAAIRMDRHMGNAWFRASHEHASKILLKALAVTSEYEGQRTVSHNHSPTPAPTPVAEIPPVSVPMEAHNEPMIEASIEDEMPPMEAHIDLVTESNPEDEMLPMAAHNDPMTESSPENTEGTLWDYVSSCPSREATKCTEIRAALQRGVGKACTKRLLVNTKPIAAQDELGKKNRVLKLGGSYLKLNTQS